VSGEIAARQFLQPPLSAAPPAIPLAMSQRPRHEDKKCVFPLHAPLALQPDLSRPLTALFPLTDCQPAPLPLRSHVHYHWLMTQSEMEMTSSRSHDDDHDDDGADEQSRMTATGCCWW